MSVETESASLRIPPILRILAVWGPGLLVMLADTDAGNVVTAAQAGARWQYRLLPLILALIPALYIVQELSARLGVFSRKGFAEAARRHFGRKWALVALAALAAATFGTLVTEFTGVAGIGELYGLPRPLTLSFACVLLLMVAATGAYRRVERAALLLGLLEGAFLIVAWKARPHPLALAHDVLRAPFGNRNFLFLAAAIVGSVFNPWMIFYQQSATARKGVKPRDFFAARWDTALGATLTQLLTGAVLVASAAALYRGDGVRSLDTIGQIGEALTAALGPEGGRLIYSLGVLGASFAAAIVASLALSWGVAELFSPARGAQQVGLFDSPAFFALYAASAIGSALLALFSRDLIWLNIVTQVANALLFPFVIGLLIALAMKIPPARFRLRGFSLALAVAVGVSVAVFGLVGLFSAWS